MARNLWSVILLSLVLLNSAVAIADGDFYGGGPWGTKITHLPCTITAPGHYYLASNLTYAGGNGINIASDDVTLDLMGFTLNGVSGIWSGIIIGYQKNVEIRNGTLTGWYKGIKELYVGAAHRIINVRSVASGDAIYLAGTGNLIKGCNATASGAGTAIHSSRGSTVIGCVATCATGSGIVVGGGSAIIGNVVIGNGGTNSIGIDARPGEPVLCLGNEVKHCYNGMRLGGGASIINNTIMTLNGQIGIFAYGQDLPYLSDQNTVLGPGNHYFFSGTTPITRNNSN
jgi:hypothetical protein